MKIRKKISIVLICLVIGACKADAPMRDLVGSSSSGSEQAMDSNSQHLASTSFWHSGASPVADLSAALKKDMAYADLRKLVVAAGWSPVADPQCEKNVGDGSAICEHLPEVEACSGDGYCVMHFERVDNRERLDVTTYGMVEDWNVSGEESRLNVVDWTFSNEDNG